MTRRKNDRIRILLGEFQRMKKPIRSRLAEFAAVPSSEYFYELGYCLLTPQSSALHAGRAIETLRKEDFLGREFDASMILRRKDSYIRFHNTKARRLQRAKENLGTIVATLGTGMRDEALREWLVRNVDGLGWKEASHFLRNIGYRNLAILDRHILKNLKKQNVIRRYPESLTKKQYLAIELKFRRFAGQCGLTIDELDLFFWSAETGQILK
ncbi:MAG: N-glycosylase/DNA lyase [Ignavibacteria bacterium]|nr:N-glycosylase/DNA lyase [Ignavibacteria bacterium]